MKQFSAKTVDDAVAQAAKELGVDADELVFKVLEEKKALFGKKATIEVYELSDVIEFAQEYVKSVIESLGIGGVTTNASLEDDIIRIEIDSDHNPILIGKNGVTLQALNEITRLAVSGKYRRRYRILLDIGDYKDGKYARVASIARRVAKDVQRSHQDAVLDPMPSDERRVVHNALSNFSHIKTESNGEGRRRAVTIKYVD
jgi:spoIIIJ-associated protein